MYSYKDVEQVEKDLSTDLPNSCLLLYVNILLIYSSSWIIMHTLIIDSINFLKKSFEYFDAIPLSDAMIVRGNPALISNTIAVRLHRAQKLVLQ